MLVASVLYGHGRAGRLGGVTAMVRADDTVAQQWNEALLDAIRIDFPAPLRPQPQLLSCFGGHVRCMGHI